MTTRTYPVIDLFYKVRDRIDAYTDAAMTHSILYKKRKEGKSKRNVVVNFDWAKPEAQYSNFGKKSNPIPIQPGSFDPLSVFYAFRLHAHVEYLKLRLHPRLPHSKGGGLEELRGVDEDRSAQINGACVK